MSVSLSLVVARHLDSDLNISNQLKCTKSLGLSRVTRPRDCCMKGLRVETDLYDNNTDNRYYRKYEIERDKKKSSFHEVFIWKHLAEHQRELTQTERFEKKFNHI